MARRVYSAEEIFSCLHFVRLNTVHDDGPEWWPCFLFENMVELETVTKQLDLNRDNISARDRAVIYLQHSPDSVACKVALLLGGKPPVVCMFDVASRPLTVEPFLLKLVDLSFKYRNHEGYMNAVKIALPWIVASATEVPADEEQQPEGKPAATCDSQKGAAVDEAASIQEAEDNAASPETDGAASFPSQKRPGGDTASVAQAQEAKRQKQDTECVRAMEIESTMKDPPQENNDKKNENETKAKLTPENVEKSPTESSSNGCEESSTGSDTPDTRSLCSPSKGGSQEAASSDGSKAITVQTSPLVRPEVASESNEKNGPGLDSAELSQETKNTPNKAPTEKYGTKDDTIAVASQLSKSSGKPKQVSDVQVDEDGSKSEVQDDDDGSRINQGHGDRPVVLLFRLLEEKADGDRDHGKNAGSNERDGAPEHTLKGKRP